MSPLRPTPLPEPLRPAPRGPDCARAAIIAHQLPQTVGRPPPLLRTLRGEMLPWEEAACLAATRGADDEARTSATRCSTLAASLGASTVERRLAARLRRLDIPLGSRGARRRPSRVPERYTCR